MLLQHSLFIFLLVVLTAAAESTIYEVLKSHGLPMGLLPKGVNNFTVDNSGRFVVHLEQPCDAKFEVLFHFDKNISGVFGKGQIDEVSGIKAEDLFLWFDVKRIRVDVPSSGLIYFDVGVVSKQFSLSSFDSPRECTAGPDPETLPRDIRYKLHDKGNFGNAIL